MSVEIVESPKRTCDLCGCVYSFGKEDMQNGKKHKTNRQVSLKEYRSYYDCRLFVVCPVCGTEHVLKTWEESEIIDKKYM